MKLRIFTAISGLLFCLLFALPVAEACWHPGFSTRELWLYRIFPYDTPIDYNGDETQSNCQLWQQQTSSDIPLEHVKSAVYQYSYQQWKWVENYISGKSDIFTTDTVRKLMDNNAFVKYIVLKNDTEALDFLLLAKRVEETRAAMRDPWYYSADFDEEHATLREIVVQCQRYSSSRFATRYALQAMRTLFSLKQFDECVRYWESVEKKLSQDVLYGMAENYAGGAYLKMGNKERALSIFLKNNDIVSIQAMGYNYQKAFELLLDKKTNSSYFPGRLQEMIDSYEYHTWYLGAYEDGVLGEDDKYVVQAKWLNQLAVKAADNPKVNDPLLWAYVAACTYDFLGQRAEGLAVLQKYIHRKSSNEFLNQSAEVLRIYLRAKTTRYDLTAPETFLADMQWLEKAMKKEIQSKPKEGRWYSYSFFFGNAWERILLECAVPNALSAGDTLLAISYANAAENHLINERLNQDVHHPFMSPIKDVAPYLAGPRTDERWAEMVEKNIQIHHNLHDYSNQMFNLVDSLQTSTIIRYWEAVQSPHTPAERYWTQCSYLDADYWQEIIGTHALRELNYPLAVTYLSKVSSDYQYRTNVYRDNCMWRNPFHYNPKYNLQPIDDNRDYKLTFAQDMAGLEQKMNHSSDPNVRARSMILYALGMKNSMNWCWALTYYSKTSYQWLWIDGEEEEEYKKYFDMYAPAEAKYRTQVWNQADSLIQAAFPLFTDPEQAAMEYSKLAMVWKVAELYPDTETGRWLSRHCDQWEDYVKAAKGKK